MTIQELIAEEELAGVILDVCETLYLNGIAHVHLGGLMRLVGVDDDVAQEHDDTYLQLSEEFAEQLEILREVDRNEIGLNLHDDDVNPTIH